MTISKGGNVGIGTTNPQSNLEVQSSGSNYNNNPTLIVKDVSNRGTMLLESATDNPTDFVFKNNNRFSWVMSTRSSSENYALRIYPSINGTSWSNPTMTFHTSGSVGIGTTNPDLNFKLSVNGAIRSKEVKVEANWSDFVFEDDYELRNLEEVEEHIKEKGHLPEIPSEAEVTQNGINLGEMDAKLLQKIEELTLYIIDINKQLKSQSERVEQLEQKNSELKEEISTLKSN